MKTRLLIFVLVLLVLIQFIPYGRDHANPKVIAEPAWDSLQTRALFMRACGPGLLARRARRNRRAGTFQCLRLGIPAKK